MTEDIYKVQTNRQGMKFITMPKTAEGFYLRKVCQDGAVTFLPIKLPKSEIVPPAVPVLEVKKG